MAALKPDPFSLKITGSSFSFLREMLFLCENLCSEDATRKNPS
jgi:hypothetical protein